MWGGVRANPLYNTPGNNPSGESEEFLDQDSLGDLDEFSDADFETFADSLLAESEQDFEDALFGAQSLQTQSLQASQQENKSAWSGLRNGLEIVNAIDELDD